MTRQTGQRCHQTTTTTTTTTADTETPLHIELAAEAVLEGWTRERVIEALIGRIRRDRGYLAYRKVCNRRMSYDEQVWQDMRALALAACWLDESAPPTRRISDARQ
jgi:hypothetical protein